MERKSIRKRTLQTIILGVFLDPTLKAFPFTLGLIKGSIAFKRGLFIIGPTQQIDY